MDGKRKGKLIYCEKCNRKRFHKYTGADEKDNITKDELGKVYTAKVNYFICECGNYKVIDRW